MLFGSIGVFIDCVGFDLMPHTVNELDAPGILMIRQFAHGVAGAAIDDAIG